MGRRFDSLEFAVHFKNLEHCVANLLFLQRSNVEASLSILDKVVWRGFLEGVCFDAGSDPGLPPNRSFEEKCLCASKQVLKSKSYVCTVGKNLVRLSLCELASAASVFGDEFSERFLLRTLWDVEHWVRNLLLDTRPKAGNTVVKMSDFCSKSLMGSKVGSSTFSSSRVISASSLNGSLGLGSCLGGEESSSAS